MYSMLGNNSKKKWHISMSMLSTNLWCGYGRPPDILTDRTDKPSVRKRCYIFRITSLIHVCVVPACESKCVCTHVYTCCATYVPASYDFALTQCQWQCPCLALGERFLGLGLLRSFNPLTLLTHLLYCMRPTAALVCALFPTTFYGPDEENQHASTYATTSRGHVVKKLHF